jgi:hypothetical protein
MAFIGAAPPRSADVRARATDELVGGEVPTCDVHRGDHRETVRRKPALAGRLVVL